MRSNLLCKYVDSIEELGLKAIQDIMDAIGGWPAVKGDSWDEKSWTWTNATIECRKHGYSTDYVMDFSVSTDLKNSTNKLVDVRLSYLKNSRKVLVLSFSLFSRLAIVKTLAFISLS